MRRRACVKRRLFLFSRAVARRIAVWGAEEPAGNCRKLRIPRWPPYARIPRVGFSPVCSAIAERCGQIGEKAPLNFGIPAKGCSAPGSHGKWLWGAGAFAKPTPGKPFAQPALPWIAFWLFALRAAEEGRGKE
jgi:hypothetical protein